MPVIGQVDISGAIRKLDSSRGTRSAIARTLNKVGTSGRTQAAREIQAAGYNMKIHDIKDAITVAHRATQGDLNVEIRARGKPIPLIQFSARQTRSGVSVNVKRGRTTLAHAFIAIMPSGHKGVFNRVGTGHKRVLRNGRVIRSGLPIKELFGPSIKAAFKNPQVAEAVVKTIRERFPIVLKQELNYEALR